MNLSDAAKRHLWMHFTRLDAFNDGEVPVIARGEGCYVFDEHGKRYLDGLSGLFTVQVGHGRAELADAARKQSETLGYFPVWGFAHEPAITLASRLASMAPGDLNRVFFTPSGGDAVETAIKLSRQYWKMRGRPNRTKVISRYLAYHGTSMGALSLTGVPAIRAPFEPLLPGAIKVQTPYRFRCHDCMHLDACTLRCADDLALRIEMEGSDSVAAVFMEPVQNTGGAFTPPEGYWRRVREICDEYDVLLVSDEVIAAFGRFGHMFGSIRYEYQPDLITFAKGVTSGYAPLGGVIVSDRVAEPFFDRDGKESPAFMQGQTFGAHPVSCAVAHANLDVFERDDICGHVRAHEARFKQLIDGLRDIPLVGDVRGAGYFLAIELVPDQASRTVFTPEQSKWLLRDFLSPRLYAAGLICRADDRGEPVITLSPPLIASEDEFAFIESVLRRTLTEASSEFAARNR